MAKECQGQISGDEAVDSKQFSEDLFGTFTDFVFCLKQHSMFLSFKLRSRLVYLTVFLYHPLVLSS